MIFNLITHKCCAPLFYKYRLALQFSSMRPFSSRHDVERTAYYSLISTIPFLKNWDTYLAIVDGPADEISTRPNNMLVILPACESPEPIARPAHNLEVRLRLCIPVDGYVEPCPGWVRACDVAALPGHETAGLDNAVVVWSTPCIASCSIVEGIG